MGCCYSGIRASGPAFTLLSLACPPICNYCLAFDDLLGGGSLDVLHLQGYGDVVCFSGDGLGSCLESEAHAQAQWLFSNLAGRLFGFFVSGTGAALDLRRSS